MASAFHRSVSPSECMIRAPPGFHGSSNVRRLRICEPTMPGADSRPLRESGPRRTPLTLPMPQYRTRPRAGSILATATAPPRVPRSAPWMSRSRGSGWRAVLRRNAVTAASAASAARGPWPRPSQSTTRTAGSEEAEDRPEPAEERVPGVAGPLPRRPGECVPYAPPRTAPDDDRDVSGPPSSMRTAQASPQLVSPLMGRVRPEATDVGPPVGPSPASRAQNCAAMTVPLPGREWMSKASASRATAPSPMPRVPAEETPSDRAASTSAMPGPVSTVTNSTPARSGVRRTRSSSAPSRACRWRLVAASLTARATSEDR